MRILGAALPAVTIILTIFLGGLALGALVAGRNADGTRAPLKIYSWLELVLALFGLLFPLLTDQQAINHLLELVGTGTQSVFNSDPVVAYCTSGGLLFVNSLLTAVVSLLILVPTLLMGATLPFAAKSIALLVSRDRIQSATVNDAGVAQPEGEEPIAQESSTEAGGIGRAVASLYTLNLFGAAAGAIAAAFVILPVTGINNSVRAAAILNLLCALILQLLHRSSANTASLEGSMANGIAAQPALPAVQSVADAPTRIPEAEAAGYGEQAADGANTDSAPAPSVVQGPTLVQLCILTALSSLSALALEVAWARLFCLVLGSSTYALGTVLTFCLLGFACGASIARTFLRRRAELAWQLAAVFCLSAILIAASLYLIADLPWMLTRLELWLSHGQSAFASYILARSALVGAMIMPIATTMGIVFPLILGHVSSKSATAASRTGILFCASTAGSIAGAALAGCVLIPQVLPLSRISAVFDAQSGMQNTFVFAALLEFVLALISFALFASVHLWHQRNETCAFIIGAIVCGVALWERPAWQPSAMSSGVSFLSLSSLPTLDRRTFENAFSTGSQHSQRLLFYREGQSATVTVGSTEANNIVYLQNDGKIEAALPLDPGKKSPTSDEPTQVLLGVIPPLFCPVEPQKAFVIGYGSGTTSGALLSNKDVSNVTIAEIEPAVYAASSYFERVNGRPLRQQWRRNGRSLPAVADARNLLAISPGAYDVIISQPAEPWVNGAADLYSLEFWQLAKTKLAPHGVFCQWLQLYAIDPEYLAVILRTFTHVFPNTVVFHPQGAGEIIILAFNHRHDTVSAARATSRLACSASTKQLLSRIGIGSGEDLVGTMVGTSDTIGAFCSREQTKSRVSALNTDNNLLTEYALPAKLFAAEEITNTNLRALLAR